ncbi:MAG: type 4a pilus biogenesis protein PilO [Candidatus Marinimicrobia bacterium]|nr:type 4a pilus biogenesis protein PilO [Candidatus Neomarinimicrobiota bacterium]MBT3759567.1 type 4a pilus biogenesis protein PilO [Candidatus Neomarinimicrobiota bacterium]MBT3894561.1 type 4a pilus biogenesis protein PilO [Candidatus Neomarinimicrobiota bacterium]MBT4537420.1 type 4a pilus biogenesis protein PilO [Candidatus Neomarinimicrobiota bacterium]MBT5211845.1 type 4a pilus biogenesis protein PilO [Candidatus Neomarinimicrobiota bacterium]
MKNKVILYISIVLTFISSVYWMWQVAYVNGLKMSNNQTDLIELQKKVDIATEKQRDDTLLKNKYGILINEFRALKAKIPSLESFASVQDFIREAAGENNVQIMWQQPFLEDTLPPIKDELVKEKSHIERYTVQVQIRGDFLSIGEFIEALINSEQLINVDKVNINTVFQKRSGQDKLNCDITLYTYIYSEEVKDHT